MKQFLTASRITGTAASAALLFFSIVLSVTGCGPSAPEREGANSDGSVSMGKKLIAEGPADGFRFYEKSDALAADGTFYSTFVTGDAQPYVNEEGKDAELFESQIYLLSYEGISGEDAQKKAAAWLAAAKELYQVTDTKDMQVGDTSYTVVSYLTKSENSPYSGGCAAFASKDSCAVYADLVFTDSWGGSAEESLLSQLEKIRFV